MDNNNNPINQGSNDDFTVPSVPNQPSDDDLSQDAGQQKQDVSGNVADNSVPQPDFPVPLDPQPVGGSQTQQPNVQEDTPPTAGDTTTPEPQPVFPDTSTDAPQPESPGPQFPEPQQDVNPPQPEANQQPSVDSGVNEPGPQFPEPQQDVNQSQPEFPEPLEVGEKPPMGGDLNTLENDQNPDSQLNPMQDLGVGGGDMSSQLDPQQPTGETQPDMQQSSEELGPDPVVPQQPDPNQQMPAQGEPQANFDANAQAPEVPKTEPGQEQFPQAPNVSTDDANKPNPLLIVGLVAGLVVILAIIIIIVLLLG